MFIDFREGGGGKEGKEERERETSISCLPYVPRSETEPASQVCALSGNQTHSLLVQERILQPPEPPSQGEIDFVLKKRSSYVSMSSIQNRQSISYFCELLSPQY